MNLTYPRITKTTPEDEKNYLIARITWHTIIPMALTYASITINPFIIILTLPMIIFQLKK